MKSQVSKLEAENESTHSKMRGLFYAHVGDAVEPKEMKALRAEYTVRMKKLITLRRNVGKQKREVARLRAAAKALTTKKQPSLAELDEKINQLGNERIAVYDKIDSMRFTSVAAKDRPERARELNSLYDKADRIYKQIMKLESQKRFASASSVPREERIKVADYLVRQRHPKITDPMLARMDYKEITIPKNYPYYGCTAVALATLKAGKSPSAKQYQKATDETVARAGTNIRWYRRRVQNQPTRNFGLSQFVLEPWYAENGLKFHPVRVGDKTVPRNCIVQLAGNKGWHVAARINGVIRDGFDVRSDPRHYQIIGYYTEKKK